MQFLFAGKLTTKSIKKFFIFSLEQAMALKDCCIFYVRLWLVGRCNSWQCISISFYACLASDIFIIIVLRSFFSLGGQLLVSYVHA